MTRHAKHFLAKHFLTGREEAIFFNPHAFCVEKNAQLFFKLFFEKHEELILLVFVLNKHKKPLMPCSPRTARKLLLAGKAKVLRRTPFTIKLKFGSAGYRQPLVGGIDAGSKTVGSAVVNPQTNACVYQSEIYNRAESIKKNMEQRASFRRTRRGNKTRYRAPRFKNRRASTRLGRLPPSTKHKVEIHFKEKKFVESILPIKKWRVETTQFDIHAISNPEVSKKHWWTYQRGQKYQFQNTKNYVLKRDNYVCKSCKKKTKDEALHVHHIQFKSNGGTDAPDNLVTLCKPCHNALHLRPDAQEFSLKFAEKKQKDTKNATEVNIVSSQIRKHFGDFEETFGFVTKIDRQAHELPKKHYIDAAVIAAGSQKPKLLSHVLIKKCTSKGDYKKTKGKHSEIKLTRGKIFGFKKYDFVKTKKGNFFIRGVRKTGSFDMCDVFGKAITQFGKKNLSITVKKGVKRLAARNIFMSQMIPAHLI